MNLFIKLDEVFTEEISTKDFLKEMVNEDFSNENLKLARAINEAIAIDTKIRLDEKTKTDLVYDLAILEEKIALVEETLSLNEGIGIINWINLYAFDGSKALSGRIEKKIGTIKTEKQKNKVVKELERLLSDAKSLANQRETNNIKTFFKGITSSAKRLVAAAPFGFIAPLISIVIKQHKGDSDEFIKALTILIKDIKAIKVSE